MKKLEIILIIIAIVAIIMNLSMIPLGGLLTVISLGALSVFYMFYKDARVIDNESAGGISSRNSPGMGLSILVVGILFKIQSWPNAKFFLIAGIASVLFFAWLNFRKNVATDNSQVNKTGLNRIIGFIAVAIVLLIIPSSKFVETKYKDYPAYVQAWKDADAHPDSLPLQTKRDAELTKMIEQRVQKAIDRTK